MLVRVQTDFFDAPIADEAPEWNFLPVVSLAYYDPEQALVVTFATGDDDPYEYHVITNSSVFFGGLYDHDHKLIMAA